MPLASGYSRETIASNIRKLLREGMTQDRAVAAAYDNARGHFRKLNPGARMPEYLKRPELRRNPVMKISHVSELNTSTPIYQERVRWPKWSVKVGPLMDSDVGGKLLKIRLSHFTKADHESAARYFLNEKKRWKGAWSALVDREHQRVFNRPFEVTDYKISGIAREEYSDATKNKLRELARAATESGAAAAAHWKAAGHRQRLPVENPSDIHIDIGSHNVKGKMLRLMPMRSNPMKDRVAIWLATKNDVNGNPRRLFVVVGVDGEIKRIIKEDYSGKGALLREFPDIAVIGRFDITPGEYRELKKMRS